MNHKLILSLGSADKEAGKTRSTDSARSVCLPECKVKDSRVLLRFSRCFL